MNWKDYIGKRCLVEDSTISSGFFITPGTHGSFNYFREVRVMELSPSGKFVYFHFRDAGADAEDRWFPVNRFVLIEVIPDKEN